QKECGKPVTATCLSEHAEKLPPHGSWDPAVWRFHGMRFLAARLLPHGPFDCRRYVVGSAAVLRQLTKAGCPEDKSRLMPLPLPAEAPPDQRSLQLADSIRRQKGFIYLGHFLPNKGVHILLDAFFKLRAAPSKLFLIWSGLGDLPGIRRQI